MSASISEWPFELLELVFHQVSVTDLLALTGTCLHLRDTALPVLLVRDNVQFKNFADRLYSAPSDDDLSLNLPEGHISNLLHALHIAPASSFRAFKALSISCVFPYPSSDIKDTIQNMMRLTGIFRRARQLGHVSLDFSAVSMWIWNKLTNKEQACEVRRTFGDLLMQIVDKDCRTLKVEFKHGSIPFPTVYEEVGEVEGWKATYGKLAERLHIPQSLRTKPVVARLVELKAIQLQSSNLTSVVASAGMLTDPFFRTTLFNIIHASKQLASLAFQFPEIGVSDFVVQGDILAQLKVPSLQSYTVQSTSHVDLPGHEDFLRRHPAITSLHFPHSYRYFSTPSRTRYTYGSLEARGLIQVLPCLEQLTCDWQVLPYFLKHMEVFLPRLQELMIVCFSGLDHAEVRLNQCLKPLEDKLSRVPIIGLRTAFNTVQFKAEDVPEFGKSLLRNRVVKLDLFFPEGLTPLGPDAFSRLHEWMLFPNIQCLMFSSMSRQAKIADDECIVKKPAERKFERWTLEDNILVCVATSYFERIPVVWFEDEVFEIDVVRNDPERLRVLSYSLGKAAG
ncbi:hypothetical protein BDN72DRAFT_570575 [Pluteus cervinus]|uniref:Uncharacterized protein n=1 Tax=Pluteus cervinus TaxID=181527 RepID=A0ACD3AWC9_9AGAR|nr:hypothetical protein BDN72DRAFT_570575 [Pluteus cervinus]